ncbi:probable glutamate receptor [Chironomus tepperi]|uniref:probable glutamate receptor n=1 Tax=Chironomus tepperi TaxID=113505 RepID=UPI00391FAC8E
MNCNKSDPLQIAEFENGKFISKPGTFFPKKFKKFHNCSLGLATFASLAPSVLKRDFKNGSYELYGRDIETMKMLAQELNFYPNITFLPEYGSWGVLYPNGTTTGAMGRAFSRNSDIAWGNLNLKLDRTLIMDYSFGYYLETLIFVIPKGEPYSAFSKLLRPFDNFVWIALLMIVLICIVIIALLSLQSRKIRSFVYGEKVSSPLLNVLIAMYGGAQTKLPTYNFARTLLIIFLLFCLVLRSLYQGALFQFLQANDNQPEVASIAEMAENNFKFYLIPSYDDMTKNNTLMKGKRVIIQPAELKTIMDNTIDAYFKGSLLVAISEIIYKNKLRAHNQEALYTVCKEPFTMIPVSLFYPKDSYLVEPIDEKLICGYYVILFENALDQDVDRIFKISWDLYIHNVNLIRFLLQ